jgi:hypothetical protein
MRGRRIEVRLTRMLKVEPFAAFVHREQRCPEPEIDASIFH